MRGGVDLEIGALILIGDVDAYRELSRLLRGSETTVIKLDSATGRPAIRSLKFLNLQPAREKTTIEISGDTASLSGSRESRGRLADEIELFMEHNDLDEAGMHMHLDAPTASAPENVLSPESRDLILAGAVPDELT